MGSSSLLPFFDLTVMIDVPEEVLTRRLTNRWQHHGLDAAAIARKLTLTDLPNARTVRHESSEADIFLSQV